MSKLRKIAPMALPATVRAEVKGPRPILVWATPTDLLVDGAYQRDLSPASVSLIRKIVGEFAWSRIKPPVAVDTGAGYHVIDGQHTAIAAASLGIKELPIFVIDAPEVLDRAQAFVSHNKNRLTISALDIHRALVAGGDPLSRSIHKTLSDVGVRMRYMSFGTKTEVGDTQCVALIQRLFKRHGVEHARSVMTSLVRAKCCPIVEPQITAASELIAEKVSPARLSMAIRVDLENDLIRARSQATIKGQRAWQILKGIWEKRLTVAQ